MAWLNSNQQGCYRQGTATASSQLLQASYSIRELCAQAAVARERPVLPERTCPTQQTHERLMQRVCARGLLSRSTWLARYFSAKCQLEIGVRSFLEASFSSRRQLSFGSITTPRNSARCGWLRNFFFESNINVACFAWLKAGVPMARLPVLTFAWVEIAEDAPGPHPRRRPLRDEEAGTRSCCRAKRGPGARSLTLISV